MSSPKAKQKVPVTVLTGFLGSGKTTLLNNILRSKAHGMRFAIIENEFGEVGVDEKLLGSDMKADDLNEEVIEVMNGCICCTVRGDLIEALKRLHTKVEKFDGVLIETTGMADPAPVAQTFFVDEAIQEMYKLDGIVTVVDALHLEQHLDKEVVEGAENESIEQLAFADRVILNKCDLVEKKIENTERSLENKKPEKNTAESDDEEIGGERVCEDVGSGASAPDDKKPKDTSEDGEKKLQKIEARIRAINPHAPIIRAQYSNVHPSKLLRLEAFNLERVLEMDPEFLNTSGEHVHDDSVSSVAWRFKGMELNVKKLNRWIGMLTQELGNDLYRYKGVLAVKGMKQKFAFQGVHMMFSGGFIDTEWKRNEKRECRFVFIGKNVKQQHAGRLEKEFLECKAEENLRFAVGDFVMACAAAGWQKAKVIKIWDEGHPYRLELQNDDKTNIWGPIDDDVCVRRFVKDKEKDKKKS